MKNYFGVPCEKKAAATAGQKSMTFFCIRPLIALCAAMLSICFAAFGGELSRLPKEFSEVEYIASSTATEYIDLGLHFKANQTLRIEWANDSLDGLNNEDKGWGVGGGMNGNNNWNITGGGRRNSGFLRPYIYAANRELKTAANQQFPTSSLRVGDWFTDACSITNTTLYYTMEHETDGVRYAVSPVTTPTSPFDSGNNIYLFKDDSQAHPYPGKKRIRSVKFSDNVTGELLADIVAVRRLTDNKPGLYDRARNAFFVNQGTGADFTFGSDKDAYRNTLEFDGEPGPFGTLTPSWGTKYIGLADGEQVICNAPVPDGSVDRSPVGWTLYEMDANDAWIKVGEGSGVSYTYVHQTGRRAKLVWEWTVPSVSNSRVAAVTASSFTVSADVTTLGATATEAKVLVAWGRTPDALVFTNEIATVTAAGPVQGTVSGGMMPSAIHFAKIIVESADGMSMDFAEPLKFQTSSTLGVSVPLEYETVEYIESHGTEWIDTTVNSSPRINIDLDIQYLSVPQGNTCFFGERVWQGHHFALWASAGNYQGTVINYGNFDPGAPGATGIEMFSTHRVISNREGSLYVDGELKYACSSYTWADDNNYSLYLFVMRNTAAGGVDNRGFCGRVYGLKMWERQPGGQPDLLLRDFVPVRRIADNAYGLYDLVEGAFHGNIGGGILSGGEHIPYENSVLTVTAEPTGEGVADPAYGVYENLTPGLTFTCFAPVSATAGGHLSCQSATVYTNAADDATSWLAWQELPVANGRVTYTHPENSNAKLVWHITAANPLGIGVVSLASAGLNSLNLSVNVTGIGVMSESAELTLSYGVTPDGLSSSKTVNVNAMGPVAMTLLPLVPGTTYYVKATLENGEGDVESAVLPFAVPAFHEEEAGRRIAYYYLKGVTACVSEVYAYGDTRVEADFTVVAPVSQCRIFTAGEYETIRSQDIAYGLYENGSKALVFCLNAAGATSTIASGIYPPAGGRYQAILDGVALRASVYNGDTGDLLYTGVGQSSPSAVDRSRFPVILGNRPVSENPLTLNSQLPADTRYHLVRIYRAGEQVSNIIPFRRASDGKTGLYDTFTRRFLEEISGNAQAIFEASPDAEEAGRTILRTVLGRNGVTVTLGGDETASTLYRVSGDTYGGDDPTAWDACTSLGVIAASATDTMAPLPEDWDDGSILTRFFTVTDISGPESLTNWSETVFWQDTNMPMFAGDLTVDGTGGDTLVVSGEMDNLGGESCTLTVYTGSSAENMTVAWTGLAGSTLTETGAFELTLFENDPSAVNYIRPGQEFFVTVEARAGQKVTRSRVASAVTPAGGRLSVGEVQISHRDVVVPYVIETLGAGGVHRIELWAGTSANALERVAYEDVDAAGVGEIAYQFDEFRTYYWQLKYVNVTAGGTVDWTAIGPSSSFEITDMSVYTWKQTVAEGDWTNSENWDTDRPGDCRGYPQTYKATAKFAAGTTAKVTIGSSVSCGPLDCMADGLDITFVGETSKVLSADVKLGEEFGTTRKTSKITIDGAKISSRNSVWMDGGMTVELVNGAELSVNGGFRLTPNLPPPLGNPLLKIGVGCTMTLTSNLDVNGDALVELAGTLRMSGFFTNGGLNETVFGGGWVRFIGDNPQMILTASGDKCRSQLSYNGAPRGGFEFVVPAKGYQNVPLVGQNIDFAMSDNSEGVVVHVLDESPAFNRSIDQIIPLMSFRSVTTNKVAFQELKREKRGATFLYAADATDPVWTVPAETTATPKVIGVKTIGTKVMTLILK